jgi:hypothetical protein
MKQLGATVLATAVLGLVVAGGTLAAGSGGVTGPAFYVDGQLYRTVLTPTDLTGTGAPSHSFQPIYDFGGLQPNVVTAAPGDPGYRGGRWMVLPLAFNSSYADAVMEHDADGDGHIDTSAELAAVLGDTGAGGATVGPVAARFVCPVIKVPAGA